MRKRSTTYSMFFVQNYTTYSYFVGQKKSTCSVFCLYKGLHAFLISANLCRGGRRGVLFLVLCGVLRRHNRDRDEDSL